MVQYTVGTRTTHAGATWGPRLCAHTHVRVMAGRAHGGGVYAGDGGNAATTASTRPLQSSTQEAIVEGDTALPPGRYNPHTCAMHATQAHTRNHPPL
jgi:hypothetical protein